jgi:hypothetical protein
VFFRVFLNTKHGGLLTEKVSLVLKNLRVHLPFRIEDNIHGDKDFFGLDI